MPTRSTIVFNTTSSILIWSDINLSTNHHEYILNQFEQGMLIEFKHSQSIPFKFTVPVSIVQWLPHQFLSTPLLLHALQLQQVGH